MLFSRPNPTSPFKFLIICFCIAGTLSARAQQTYVTEKNIRYYGDSVKLDSYMTTQCLLDLYYPKGVKNFPTVVWFHGGGLTGGGKEIPKALMEKGFAVVGIGYRFSPKVKAPAYIEDAAAATAWVFKHISEYGGNPGLIFMSGHSAGGYLSMMVTLDKKYLAKYQIDANRVAALVPFSPQMITHYTIRQERGIKPTTPQIDEYAPLFFVRPDAPPTILYTGDAELELYGRYEENAYMLRMMKLAGHKRTRLYQLQGFTHGNMPEGAFPLLIPEIRASKVISVPLARPGPRERRDRSDRPERRERPAPQARPARRGQLGPRAPPERAPPSAPRSRWPPILRASTRPPSRACLRQRRSRTPTPRFTPASSARSSARRRADPVPSSGGSRCCVRTARR